MNLKYDASRQPFFFAGFTLVGYSFRYSSIFHLPTAFSFLSTFSLGSRAPFQPHWLHFLLQFRSCNHFSAEFGVSPSRCLSPTEDCSGAEPLNLLNKLFYRRLDLNDVTSYRANSCCENLYTALYLIDLSFKLTDLCLQLSQLILCFCLTHTLLIECSPE